MSLGPEARELRARARGDLRLGLPVLLAAEGTAMLALAAETIRPERLAAARALGQPVLAITAWRAETLKARPYDGDLARLVLPDDAGAAWIAAMADPAEDLTHPMRGPFRSGRGGSPALHRAAIALAKEARLLPAAVIVPLPPGESQRLAAGGLTLLSGAALDAHGLAHLEEVAAASLPLALAGAGRLHVFRPDDGGEEHYAIEIGTPDRARPVLTRLHSACFTGDLLGSLKCDCGPQLHAALEAMGHEGAGVLLYLNQEGRGIGLANKMRAYALQDQGFDTVEANHRLGFEDDERDFRLGAELLRGLGFSRVRLLTNNPAKVARLQGCGLEVTERVPLKVGRGEHNHAYLATKAAKSGHLL